MKHTVAGRTDIRAGSRSSLRALRALGVLFLYQLFRPLFIAVSIVTVALYALMIILVFTISSWWLLALIVLIPLIIILVLAWVIIRFLTRKLLPRKLGRDEQKRLRSFIDRLLGVAERARFPYPVLLFLIAKDVLRGRESTFLSKLIGDSRELMQEFRDIQRMF